MEIRSLERTEFDMIFDAFSEAFADYEIQLNKEQLKTMFKRRGFNAGLSFAAFDAGRIVSFICNGMESFEGVPTAYDVVTGTLKSHRGKGVATRIFEYAIPRLKEQGTKRYLLEVLSHNSKAVSVYSNLGFEIRRELYYFMQKNNEIRNTVKELGSGFEIRKINIGECDRMQGFLDFHPSWQNSFNSIRRVSENFACFGVFAGNNLIGCCVFEPASGDIALIAVDRNYRRRGVGSLLLQKILEINEQHSIKLINADTACESIKGFMEAKNIAVQGKQYEMVKPI